MPLTKLPTSGLDDINHRRRVREHINSIVTHQFDDSRVRTPAEIAAGVTPVNYAYPPGDLRRYGCDTTGNTVNDTQIANALAAAVAYGGTGAIYHPGGAIQHASTILVPAGVTVYGEDRNACEFFYTGTGSAWRYTSGVVNSSGYAMVNFHRVKIRTTNTSNNGAAIELNAGGYSYFEISECWLTGTFDIGMILDAVELCHVHHNLIDTSSTTTASIWIVNGADRSVGQNAGYSNLITIADNQISADHGTGIVDDGGSVHVYTGNNLNEHDLPARFCGVDTLVLQGNSFETQEEIATANILFTNTTAFGAANVGPNRNGVIHGCAFYGDMDSGSCIQFKGAVHTAFNITGCEFGNLLGRGGAIDVEKLGNSFCGYNYDVGQSGMEHYVNVHHDSDGNTLLPPQNGFAVTLGIAGHAYGDTRYPHIFYGGAKIKTGAEFNEILVGSKTFDWPSVAAGGSTNTTVTVTGAALGDVVIGVSMSLDTGVLALLAGHVESANTVRVAFYNFSAGAIDLASGTLKVLVAHAS